MAEREQRKKPSEADAEQVEHVPKAAAKESTLADGLDDLLDEIDEVLETNAEEFVKSYVQKGGE